MSQSVEKLALEVGWKVGKGRARERFTQRLSSDCSEGQKFAVYLLKETRLVE